MNYVPIPLAMLPVGHPLPINIVSSTGQLLLRKGQSIMSIGHRDKLETFQASATQVDAQAWQRAYERMVQTMMREGAELAEIAAATLPLEIRATDYIVGQAMRGGWLDLLQILRGTLYQGGLAIESWRHLADVETNALRLLAEDADDALFRLFQSLGDSTLGYSATHALLCFVLCELTAARLNTSASSLGALRKASLTMNIGMARDQDAMARQGTALSDWQRTLVDQHAQSSVDILRGFGFDDVDHLDIVRWHHVPDSPEGLAHNAANRRLLALADSFVARVSARKTRAALTTLKAVKSMVLEAQGDTLGMGSAMAQAVGFYPPGSYVQLVGGEIAVSAQRGSRANTPWVISVVDRAGMPVVKYDCIDTSEPGNAIAGAVTFDKVKTVVSADRVRKARERIVKPKTL
jgi:hypothetical protein